MIHRKKTFAIILLVLALFIPTEYLVLQLVVPPYLTPLGENYFQLIGVDVKDQHETHYTLWKRQGVPESDPIHKVNTLANRLLSLSKKPGSLLNRTFGNVCMNWLNSTVYVAITELTPENIDSIERTIGRHENISVVYVKAHATYRELERCLRILDERRLIRTGAFAEGVSRDAAVLIGLSTVSFGSVNLFLFQYLDIPRSAVEFRVATRYVLAS